MSRAPRKLIRREWGTAQGPEWRDDDDLVVPAPLALPAIPAPVVAELLDNPPAGHEEWGPHFGRESQAGSSHPRAEEIRLAWSARATRVDLARQFGLTLSMIKNIVRSPTYRPALPSDADIAMIRRLGVARHRIDRLAARFGLPCDVIARIIRDPDYQPVAPSRADVAKIRLAWSARVTHADLATRFGVSISTIKRVIARGEDRAWNDD